MYTNQHKEKYVMQIVIVCKQ